MAQATEPTAAGEARPSALGDATIGYSPQRLLSLDVFRGATIIFMIIVNSPGIGEYALAPLEHTAWHGMTPTDWVFPFFLFIMGVAMAYSFAKRLAQAGSKTPLYLKTLIRFAAIMAIGWGMWLIGATVGNKTTLAEEWPNISKYFRPFGVLPRIAWVYLFAGFIVLTFRGWKPVLAISIGLLAVYWLLMVLVPFPGKTADPWAFGLNVNQWFDFQVLKQHMRFPTEIPKNADKGPFGRESLGIISTLPAIVNTLAGYLCGLWLRTARDGRDKTIGMFAAGFGLLALASFWAADLGYAIAPELKPVQYSIFMPLNKELWTASYALYTTGLALLALATCYWLIDLKGRKGFTQPFVVYGSNAIFVYAGSVILIDIIDSILLRFGDRTLSSILVRDVYARGWEEGVAGSGWLGAFTPYFASIMWPLTIIVVWWGILTFMYRRKWFLKV